MNEIPQQPQIQTQMQNLNAHYTTQAKVTKPERVVVSGPDNVPQYHIYSDKEANEKLTALNNDVYISVQKAPKPKKKKFFELFS